MNIGEIKKNASGQLIGSVKTIALSLTIGLRPVMSNNPRAPKFDVVVLSASREWVTAGALYELASNKTGEIFSRIEHGPQFGFNLPALQQFEDTRDPDPSAIFTAIEHGRRDVLVAKPDRHRVEVKGQADRAVWHVELQTSGRIR